MPRPPRPIADGLIYHVINRGNNRQPVFFGEGDYVAFLTAVKKREVNLGCGPAYGWFFRRTDRRLPTIVNGRRALVNQRGGQRVAARQTCLWRG